MTLFAYKSYQLRAIALVLGLVLPVVWCAPCAAETGNNPVGSADSAPQLSVSQLMRSPRAAGAYQIMRGELALARGDTAQAAQAYGKALMASQQPDLAKRTMQVAVSAKQLDLAFRAAKIWAEARTDNASAQRAAVRLAFLNRDEAGIQHFIPRLIGAADSQRTGYEMLAQTFGGKPDRADLAISALKTLTQAHPEQAAAQYTLARLALNYHRIDLASKAIKRAVEDEPHWAQAVLLQANIDVQQGRFDTARKRVSQLSGSTSERSGYHVVLARVLLQAGQSEAGQQAFQKAVTIDPDNMDARYGLGLVALSRNDLDSAHTQFDKLFRSDAHVNDAAFFLGVVAEDRDHGKRAMHWYKRVHEGQHAFEARLRIARLIYQQGDLAEARTQLHKLAERYPERRARLLAVEGGLLMKAGQPETALEAYDRALAEAPDNNDLLYARSLSYAKLDRVADAKADLKQILDQDPDNAAALNALGYVLTNHSTDYARAEQYIRKSLAQDPDNPAVLDSLGWVEYKRGDLDSARRHLEKAYSAQPDPEVAAHLGEVRWKQGDHDAARKVWHKATTAHPHNKVLKQTIKRLTS